MGDAEFMAKLKLNADRAVEELNRLMDTAAKQYKLTYEIKDLEFRLAHDKHELAEITKQGIQPFSSAQVQAIFDKACQELKVEMEDYIKRLFEG